jgi:hypothetical protein
LFDERLEALSIVSHCLSREKLVASAMILKIDKLSGDLEYRGEPEVMKALLLTPDEDAPSGESGLISTGGR